ncbi:hemerythrin domain-containing protein [Endothiovibrio diazotrophicus]
MEPIDFSNPLDALRRFHQLNREQCAALEALAEAAEGGAEVASLGGPAGEILRHFTAHTALHHRDEEEELFPLLARQTLKLADRVHHARSAHQAIEGGWRELAELLRKPAAIAADPAAFAARARAFAELESGHCNFEDEELLEIAQHILSRDDLTRIGKAMKKRRGIG